MPSRLLPALFAGLAALLLCLSWPARAEEPTIEFVRGASVTTGRVLGMGGVAVAPLRPSNCGFDVLRADAPVGETRRAFFQELIGRTPTPAVGWSPHFAERFVGQPFKTVALLSLIHI